MSTPSLTMLTATIQRSEPRVNACSLSAARLGVQDDGRLVAADVAEHARDGAGVLADGGDDEAAGVAVAAGAHALEALVGGGEDARQPVGELDRDRGAVAPAGLAAGERVGERRLD